MRRSRSHDSMHVASLLDAVTARGFSPMTVAMDMDYDNSCIYAECAERDVAIQTIKSIARGPWLGRERTSSTWYEPMTEQRDIDLALWWAMGRPGVFLNSTGDVDLLPRFLDAASRFAARPSEAEMDELVARAHPRPLFV